MCTDNTLKIWVILKFLLKIKTIKSKSISLFTLSAHIDSSIVVSRVQIIFIILRNKVDVMQRHGFNGGQQIEHSQDSAIQWCQTCQTHGCLFTHYSNNGRTRRIVTSRSGHVRISLLPYGERVQCIALCQLNPSDYSNKTCIYRSAVLVSYKIYKSCWSSHLRWRRAIRLAPISLTL